MTNPSLELRSDDLYGEESDNGAPGSEAESDSDLIFLSNEDILLFCDCYFRLIELYPTGKFIKLPQDKADRLQQFSQDEEINNLLNKAVTHGIKGTADYMLFIYFLSSVLFDGDERAFYLSQKKAEGKITQEEERELQEIYTQCLEHHTRIETPFIEYRVIETVRIFIDRVDMSWLDRLKRKLRA